MAASKKPSKAEKFDYSVLDGLQMSLETADNTESQDSAGRTGKLTFVFFYAIILILIVVIFVFFSSKIDLDFSYTQLLELLLELLLVGCFFLIFFVVIGYKYIVAYFSKKSQEMVAEKLLGFTAVNGLEYLKDVHVDSLKNTFGKISSKNSIFDKRNTYERMTHLLGDESFNIAEYEYKPALAESELPKYWTLASIRLSRTLPHVLIDARSNNIFDSDMVSSLPAKYELYQVVVAEAIFQDHFTLYAPEGYHIDSLSFVAPDFIAVLIDYFTEFDIEIIDNRLLIYKQGKLAPEDVEQMIRRLHLLASELEDNADSYRDARLQDLQNIQKDVLSFTAIGKQGSRLSSTLFNSRMMLYQLGFIILAVASILGIWLLIWFLFLSRVPK